MKVRIQIYVVAVVALAASVIAAPVGAQTAWSCNGVAATIVGTTGDDTIQGTPGPDVIVARQGNDVIDGLGGDDIVCAGKGDDNIIGGDGFDIIFAAQGNDVIFAATGESESARADSKGARMFGGAGNDIIHGSNRWDRMQGGPGQDTMYGYEGRDWIRAGADNDSVDGGPAIDDLHGGNGKDTIMLTDGDSVRGGAGADTCVIGMGEPKLQRSCETVIEVSDPLPPPSDAKVEVVRCDARTELVDLKNTGGKAITLTGWTLEDRGPEWTFKLDEVTLAPDETVRLQFGTKANIPGTIRMSDRNIWNNTGDTAFLITPNGTTSSELNC